MKTKLILIITVYLLFIPFRGITQAQKGSDYPVLSQANYAIFIIDYPDTKTNIRALYPTVDEIKKEIFDSTRFIQRYLKTISYGKFKLTGDVFGPFTHQDSVTSKNSYQMDSYATINTISIPGFQSSKYTHFAFISYNDWNPGGGCSYGNTGKTLTINNVKYTIPQFFRMVLAIGPYNRNPSYGFTNQYTDLFMTQIFVPISELPGGEHFFANYSGLTVFQRVFLHELLHTLGEWTHANSSTNGNRCAFEPEIPENNGFLKYEYGNSMDMMGNAQWGLSLNGGFRDIFGWTDQSNRIKLENFGQQRVRLYPINRKSGTRICEIRIPNHYYTRDPLDLYNYPVNGRKNQGYFLEVREADRWDSTLNHLSIKDNTSGIILMSTDGWTTSLLDASPSPNLKYEWGSIPDLRNVVLKPGMKYHDPHVSFSGVEKHTDGSYSVDIEIVDPSILPGKTILNSPSTIQMISGMVSLKWKESRYADYYYLQVSKDPALSTVIKSDSTRTDTTCVMPGLENNTKYYWRVRGKNAAGYGLWSDVGNFTTTLTGIDYQRFSQNGILLSQNYPNPFASATSISYSIHASCHVQLKVFDNTGREVAVLVNKEQIPGVYDVRFNPVRLPEGVLFYELKAGSYAITRKMVYIKQ
jgi:hypothetical protein